MSMTMTRLHLVFVLAFAACTDSPAPAPTEPPASPPAPLVASRAEPAGANCTYGGTALESGLDLDGNGTLDPDEVTSTAYACVPTPRQLVVTRPEPHGDNCWYGGTAIDIGFDTNGNGVLDADEVSGTSYVCTASPVVVFGIFPEPPGPHCPYGGQAIETGQDLNYNGSLDPSEATATSYACLSAGGVQPLIRVDAEPSGVHCPDGGSAIRVGTDVDHDGILDDGEIGSTTYVCGTVLQQTVIQGDVEVENSAQFAALAGVTEITGSLSVTATVPLDITLPDLRRVDGSIAVSCYYDDGCAVSLPSLVSATSVSLEYVSAVDLPNLESGAVTIDGSFVLDTLALPRLATGSLLVRGEVASVSLPAFSTGSFDAETSSLTSVDLPVFESGELHLRGASATTLSLPSFASGRLHLETMSALTTLTAPSFATGDFQLLFANSLTLVDLPAWQTGDLYFWSNAHLAALTLPSYTASTWFVAERNPELPTCALQALVAQSHPPQAVLVDNDDTATCP